MSDMVPEVLNAALDSLFTPKEPGEQEYQGVDGLLYCRNCHTPVQCRVKLWGRDKIVPCLCRCQQEAMAEKKRQDELVERQRKIRQLKATGIQEKHLLEWNFGVAEDNKDIQMAKRYVEQWKKVKAENLGLLLWGDVGTGKSFVAACIANALLDQGIPVLMTNFSKILNQMGAMYSEERYRYIASFSNYSLLILDDLADLKVKSYDVEAWSPRQKKYFEVGSCSNLGDAQARRLGIKVKGKDGKYFAHTLNNTVVAPPRMLIAFLENNLNEDGSINIPKVLQPYMGGKTKIC